MEKDFDYIKIYRKILGQWFYVNSINRWDEEGMKVLHRTRDHYRSLWGYKKVKLVLCWNNEDHIF